MEMRCAGRSEVKALLSMRILCSGDSTDDRFEVNCRYFDMDESQKGTKPWMPLVQRKGILIDKPFEAKFHVPQKYVGKHIFWIGKNLATGLDPNEKPQLHPLGIRRYEVTGKLDLENFISK